MKTTTTALAAALALATSASARTTLAQTAPPPAPPAQPQAQYAPYAPPPYSYGYAPAEPEMKRRSTGLMAAGIVMTSVGALTALAGGVIYAGATKYETVDCGIEGVTCATAERRDDSGQQTAGMFTMIGGIALIGAGIPMIIIGAKKVPATRAMVRVGPSSVSLRASF